MQHLHLFTMVWYNIRLFGIVTTVWYIYDGLEFIS